MIKKVRQTLFLGVILALPICLGLGQLVDAIAGQPLDYEADSLWLFISLLFGLVIALKLTPNETKLK